MLPSSVWVSDISRSGRLMLPNLVIQIQHSSLGGGWLLLSCELPYKQSRSLNTESHPPSLCSNCGHINMEGIWTKVQSQAEFLTPSQPFLHPWAAFRLSYGHTSQTESWPHPSLPPLGLPVTSKSVPLSGGKGIKDVMCQRRKTGCGWKRKRGRIYLPPP